MIIIPFRANAGTIQRSIGSGVAKAVHPPSIPSRRGELICGEEEEKGKETGGEGMR